MQSGADCVGAADEVFGMDGLNKEVSIAWNSGVLSGFDIGSTGNNSFSGRCNGHIASPRACSKPDNLNNLAFIFFFVAVALFALSL
jgi:hypothetical protein